MLLKVVIISLFYLVLEANCDNPEAKEKCRSVHHTDVDEANYFNYKCKLICNIHNQLWPHNMSEGMPCPELVGTVNRNMVCKSGECVIVAKLGFIDVEIASAEVPHKSNAYAEVCIQNTTTSSSLTLPLRDRSSCICQTNVIESSAHPVWQKVCTGLNTNKYTDSSKVIFEVWDKISSNNNNFIGGSSLTIQELIAKGESHKEIKMALIGGQSASVFVRVTWTPQ